MLRNAETPYCKERPDTFIQQLPSSKIGLTPKGEEQAVNIGKKLKEIIKDESVKFYLSPY